MPVSTGHRAPGSEGYRCPLCQPPSQKITAFLNARSPSGRNGDLGCPFVKHNPEAYRHARNACTLAGFPSIGPLRDHIKRVHLLAFGCPLCNTRFTSLTSRNKGHKCDGTKKLRQELEVEITTEEQEERYLRLDFRRSGLTGEAAFKEIFRTLWPETPQADIPDAYFKPFLFSMPEIKAALEEMEMEKCRCASTIPETEAGGSFIAPEPPAPDPAWPPLSPLLYAQSLQYPDPYFAGRLYYPNAEINNSTERGTHYADCYTAQEHPTSLEPPAPPAFSTQNLGINECLSAPSFAFTVTQAKPSADSGYNTLEQSDIDTASSSTAVVPHEHNPHEHNPHLFLGISPGDGTWTDYGPDLNIN